MPIYFFDTSALAKHYHTEKGTPEVDRILSEQGSRFFISRLSAVEIQSVFASKVRNNAITTKALQNLQKRFAGDLSSRLLSVMKVFPSHLREAEKLIKKHAPTKSFRTLDAIQLTFALELKRKNSLDFFVCADDRFCVIAQDEGLSVINPEII
jgi:predicted nucleic acid-binding protein